MMKIALFADIHGNPIALDAILNDIQSQGGVDEYWVLGDLAAIGYDPIGILERLQALPNCKCIRGNTDRYLVQGIYPGPKIEDIKANPGLITTFESVLRSFAWTQGAVTVTDWVSWLKALQVECYFTLPDGTRTLAVHASPGLDDGEGFHPGLDDSQTTTLFSGCEADVIFSAHNHWFMDAKINGTRVINVGSVSNPFPPDLRACYVMLTCGKQGYVIEEKRVAYDRAAVIKNIQNVKHPAAHYLIGFMRGEHLPKWHTI